MTGAKITNREKLNIAAAAAAAAAVLAMGYISVSVYGAPLGSMAVMAAFFALYVQIPGLLIIRYAGLDRGHISTALALGMFAGWSFEIAVYFIADLLKADILLLLAGPLMSLAFIYAAVIKGDRKRLIISRLRIRRLSPAFCAFMALILFYCLVNTQYLYVAPELSDFTYMNPDKAYHMGLINSLSHDYPLMSPWINGVEINYHIFSEMLFSIPVKFFDVQADAVTQSFGPFLTAYCFGTCYYSFFREMSRRPERAGVYSLIVVLSNLYISRYEDTSLAFKFILINDNSSGYGMAACLMTIILIGRWHDAFREKKQERHILLILCAAFVMVTTGIKGPMGAVTVAALWGTMALGMLLRKISPKTLPALMLITAGFMLVYTTVLGSKGQANASGASLIEFGEMVDYSYWQDPLIAFLKAHGIPGSARLLIVLTVFMMFFLSVFFIPFCIGYIREIIMVLSGRKDFVPEKVLVYAECTVGLIALFFLNYSGHSQVYFGLVSAFLAPVIAYWFLEDMEELQPASKTAKYVLNATVCVMGLTLLVTTWSLTSYLGSRIEIAEAEADPAAWSDPYLNISRSEYEAMEWIEKNTPEDALLAVDRYYSVDPEHYSYQNRWDNRYFLYAVYSNRFSYIAGSGYNMRAAEWPRRKEMIETNEKLYDPDNASRGDLARELGVDYVVVSRRFTDIPDLSNGDYELCFSNDGVDIYKIAS